MAKSFLGQRLVCFLVFIFSTLVSQAQKDAVYTSKGDSLLYQGKYAVAQKYYDSALKINSKSEMAFRGKGFCYYRSGNHTEAKNYYQKALKVNPGCLRCEYWILNILTAEGKTDEAIKRADSVITAYKDTGKNYQDYSDIVIISAHLNYNAGNEINAETLLDGLVNKFTDSAWAYAAKADFNYTRKSKSAALRDIEKAIRLDDSKAGYYFLKAKIFIDIQSWDNALSMLNNAVLLNSDAADIYAWRGGVYVALQQYDAAMADYHTALSFDSSSWFYNAKLAELYSRKENMDSMCICYRHSYNLLGNDTSSQDYKLYYADTKGQLNEFCDNSKSGYYYQRGIAMYNLQLYDSAVSFYNAGLKKFPNHPLLLSFRANAYLAQAKWANAEKDYLLSNNHPAELLAACIERFNGDRKPGEFFYQGILSSNFMSLSDVYVNLGMIPKAKTCIDSAIKLAPIGPEVPLDGYYNQKGRVYLAEGNYDSARQEFENALRLNPNNLIAYCNIAISIANKALETPDRFMTFGLSAYGPGLLGNQQFRSEPIRLTNNQQMLFQDALEYCNKAIGLESRYGGAYLVRGEISRVMDRPGYCDDFKTARDLGFSAAADYYAAYCR